MSSWLTVAIATVTCLLLSPITCLPLHDEADGKERRELLHNRWLGPSGSTNEGSQELVDTSKTLDKRGNVDSIQDLLLALQDTNTHRRGLYQRRGNESLVDDYGYGLFLGKRDSTWRQQRGLRAKKYKEAKRGEDDYGFGLFFGKRNDDYDDFTL